MRGSGVVMPLQLKLSHFRVNIPEVVEALWVRVTPPRYPLDTASIIYCVVYHPPRSPTAQLLTNHIIDTADVLRVRFPAAKLVICRDFNRLEVSDILHQLHLIQVVDFPTYNQTTFDLIITDLAQQYSPARALTPLGHSAHLTILWTPAPITSVSKSAVTRIYRPTPDSTMREFG